MATPKRSEPARRRNKLFDQIRKAPMPQTLEELVDAVCRMDCPNCGRPNLTIQDTTLRNGILIECERALCRWKVPI